MRYFSILNSQFRLIALRENGQKHTLCVTKLSLTIAFEVNMVTFQN